MSSPRSSKTGKKKDGTSGSASRASLASPDEAEGGEVAETTPRSKKKTAGDADSPPSTTKARKKPPSSPRAESTGAPGRADGEGASSGSGDEGVAVERSLSSNSAATGAKEPKTSVAKTKSEPASKANKSKSKAGKVQQEGAEGEGQSPRPKVAQEKGGRKASKGQHKSKAPKSVQLVGADGDAGSGEAIPPARKASVAGTKARRSRMSTHLTDIPETALLENAGRSNGAEASGASEAATLAGSEASPPRPSTASEAKAAKKAKKAARASTASAVSGGSATSVAQGQAEEGEDHSTHRSAKASGRKLSVASKASKRTSKSSSASSRGTRKTDQARAHPINGFWKLRGQDDPPDEIQDLKIHSQDGAAVAIRFESEGRFFVSLDDDRLYGNFSGDIITWDDGDFWDRVDAPFDPTTVLDSLDGNWKDANAGEQHMLLNGEIESEDGPAMRIVVESASNISLEVEGERVHGTIANDNEIRWEDGDVWHRVVEKMPLPAIVIGTVEPSDGQGSRSTSKSPPQGSTDGRRSRSTSKSPPQGSTASGDEALRARCAALEEERDAALQEVDRLRGAESDDLSARQGLEDKIEHLKGELDRSLGALASERAKRMTLEAKVMNDRAQAESMQQKLGQEKAARKKVEVDIEDTLVRVERLRSQLAAEKHRSQERESQLDDYRLLCGRLKKTISSQKAIGDAMEAKFEDIREELSSTRSAALAAAEKMKHSMEDNIGLMIASRWASLAFASIRYRKQVRPKINDQRWAKLTLLAHLKRISEEEEPVKEVGSAKVAASKALATSLQDMRSGADVKQARQVDTSGAVQMMWVRLSFALSARVDTEVHLWRLAARGPLLAQPLRHDDAPPDARYVSFVPRGLVVVAAWLRLSTAVVERQGRSATQACANWSRVIVRAALAHEQKELVGGLRTVKMTAGPQPSGRYSGQHGVALRARRRWAALVARCWARSCSWDAEQPTVMRMRWTMLAFKMLGHPANRRLWDHIELMFRRERGLAEFSSAVDAKKYEARHGSQTLQHLEDGDPREAPQEPPPSPRDVATQADLECRQAPPMCEDAEAQADIALACEDAEVQAEFMTPCEDAEAQADLARPGEDAEAQADIALPGEDAEAQADIALRGEDVEVQADFLKPCEDVEVQASLVAPGEDVAAQADIALPGEGAEAQADIALPGAKADIAVPGEEAEAQADIVLPEVKAGIALPGEDAEAQTDMALPGEDAEAQDDIALPGEDAEAQTDMALPGEDAEAQADIALPGKDAEAQADIALPFEDAEAQVDLAPPSVQRVDAESQADPVVLREDAAAQADIAEDAAAQVDVAPPAAMGAATPRDDVAEASAPCSPATDPIPPMTASAGAQAQPPLEDAAAQTDALAPAPPLADASASADAGAQAQPPLEDATAQTDAPPPAVPLADASTQAALVADGEAHSLAAAGGGAGAPRPQEAFGSAIGVRGHAGRQDHIALGSGGGEVGSLMDELAAAGGSLAEELADVADEADPDVAGGGGRADGRRTTALEAEVARLRGLLVASEASAEPPPLGVEESPGYELGSSQGSAAARPTAQPATPDEQLPDPQVLGELRRLQSELRSSAGEACAEAAAIRRELASTLAEAAHGHRLLEELVDGASDEKKSGTTALRTLDGRVREEMQRFVDHAKDLEGQLRRLQEREAAAAEASSADRAAVRALHMELREEQWVASEAKRAQMGLEAMLTAALNGEPVQRVSRYDGAALPRSWSAPPASSAARAHLPEAPALQSARESAEAEAEPLDAAALLELQARLSVQGRALEEAWQRHSAEAQERGRGAPPPGEATDDVVSAAVVHGVLRRTVSRLSQEMAAEGGAPPRGSLAEAVLGGVWRKAFARLSQDGRIEGLEGSGGASASCAGPGGGQHIGGEEDAAPPSPHVGSVGRGHSRASSDDALQAGRQDLDGDRATRLEYQHSDALKIAQAARRAAGRHKESAFELDSRLRELLDGVSEFSNAMAQREGLVVELREQLEAERSAAEGAQRSGSAARLLYDEMVWQSILSECEQDEARERLRSRLTEAAEAAAGSEARAQGCDGGMARLERELAHQADLVAALGARIGDGGQSLEQRSRAGGPQSAAGLRGAASGEVVCSQIADGDDLAEQLASVDRLFAIGPDVARRALASELKAAGEESAQHSEMLQRQAQLDVRAAEDREAEILQLRSQLAAHADELSLARACEAQAQRRMHAQAEEHAAQIQASLEAEDAALKGDLDGQALRWEAVVVRRGIYAHALATLPGRAPAAALLLEEAQELRRQAETHRQEAEAAQRERDAHRRESLAARLELSEARAAATAEVEAAAAALAARESDSPRADTSHVVGSVAEQPADDEDARRTAAEALRREIASQRAQPPSTMILSASPSPQMVALDREAGLDPSTDECERTWKLGELSRELGSAYDSEMEAQKRELMDLRLELNRYMEVAAAAERAEEERARAQAAEQLRQQIAAQRRAALAPSSDFAHEPLSQEAETLGEHGEAERAAWHGSAADSAAGRGAMRRSTAPLGTAPAELSARVVEAMREEVAEAKRSAAEQVRQVRAEVAVTMRELKGHLQELPASLVAAHAAAAEDELSRAQRENAHLVDELRRSGRAHAAEAREAAARAEREAAELRRQLAGLRALRAPGPDADAAAGGGPRGEPEPERGGTPRAPRPEEPSPRRSAGGTPRTEPEPEGISPRVDFDSGHSEEELEAGTALPVVVWKWARLAAMAGRAAKNDGKKVAGRRAGATVASAKRWARLCALAERSWMPGRVAALREAAQMLSGRCARLSGSVAMAEHRAKLHARHALTFQQLMIQESQRRLALCPRIGRRQAMQERLEQRGNGLLERSRRVLAGDELPARPQSPRGSSPSGSAREAPAPAWRRVGPGVGDAQVGSLGSPRRSEDDFIEVSPGHFRIRSASPAGVATFGCASGASAVFGAR